MVHFGQTITTFKHLLAACTLFLCCALVEILIQKSKYMHQHSPIFGPIKHAQCTFGEGAPKREPQTAFQTHHQNDTSEKRTSSDRLLLTYVGGDQKAPAQMLVKREAPGLSVPIHAGHVLLYGFVIEFEPHAIIIVDLRVRVRGGGRHRGNKQQKRAQPCRPVTMETAGARKTHPNNSEAARMSRKWRASHHFRISLDCIHNLYR